MSTQGPSAACDDGEATRTDPDVPGSRRQARHEVAVFEAEIRRMRQAAVWDDRKAPPEAPNGGRLSRPGGGHGSAAVRRR